MSCSFRGSTVSLSNAIAMLSLRLTISHPLSSSVEATHFQLYKRTKHVFEEAWRVLKFREVCLRAASETSSAESGETILNELGKLMDDSHDSCSKLCENSCPEVNELVRIAKEAGAYGSRITGRTVIYRFGTVLY